jgi:hypothetical protein
MVSQSRLDIPDCRYVAKKYVLVDIWSIYMSRVYHSINALLSLYGINAGESSPNNSNNNIVDGDSLPCENNELVDVTYFQENNLSRDVQPTNDRVKLCNYGLNVNIQCDVAKSLKKNNFSMAHLNIRSLCRHLEQLSGF